MIKLRNIGSANPDYNHAADLSNKFTQVQAIVDDICVAQFYGKNAKIMACIFKQAYDHHNMVYSIARDLSIDAINEAATGKAQST